MTRPQSCRECRHARPDKIKPELLRCQWADSVKINLPPWVKRGVVTTSPERPNNCPAFERKEQNQ